jgi:NADH-quinone oxidoreductase subunit J
MLLFFLLSFVILISSILLITNKNPVYSVLSLVSLFVAGSLQLLLLEADFLAFVFIIVYAGAVAVLFLFVVIILDIKQYRDTKALQQIPFVLVFFSLTFLLLKNFSANTNGLYRNIDYNLYFGDTLYWEVQDFDTSINSLGQMLYTEYVIHFVIGGLILLVAIIGAIVLTSRKTNTSLKQKTFKQSARFDSLGKNKNF